MRNKPRRSINYINRNFGDSANACIIISWVMSIVPQGSHLVTPQSAVIRPFYVVVDQVMISSGHHCLDLNEGDIFIVTRYNKVGYWWGVSVYDLDRQGWFPSALVQPYTGDVPDEAAALVARIKQNAEQDIVSAEQPQKDDKREFNIVTDDGRFEEYGVTAAVVRKGRRVHVTDDLEAGYNEGETNEEEDFDYESWSKAKLEERAKNSSSGSKKRRL